MDFSELQQRWQQQTAPVAAPAASPASLLADTEGLHRLGRQRNWRSTWLVGLTLACFLVARLLRHPSRTPLQYVGLGLLTLTPLGYLALLWWNTSLRQVIQPGLDSQAYVRASLRAFRFRRKVLPWLGITYMLGFNLGLVLWNLPHFRAVAPSDEWLLWLGLFLLAGVGWLGRQVALRKYDDQYASTVHELERWEAAWNEADDTKD